MARTRIAFRQLKLNTDMFEEYQEGTEYGYIQLKDDGVTRAKLADFTTQDKLIGADSGALTVGDQGLESRHFDSNHDYSSITAIGTQTEDLDMGNGTYKVINVADPDDGTDAANKQYVDSKKSGMSWKSSVRLKSIANIASIDSATDYQNAANTTAADFGSIVALATDDRLLIAEQSDEEENGIYVVQASGKLLRAEDCNSRNHLDGLAVFVREGDHADQGFIQTFDSWDVSANMDDTLMDLATGNAGVDVLTSSEDVSFTQFSGLIGMTGTRGIQAGHAGTFSSGLEELNEGEVGIVSEGVIADMLKAKRLVIDGDGSGDGLIPSAYAGAYIELVLPGSGTVEAYDAGMIDADLAMVFLNGVLLRMASADGEEGEDGDYFIKDDSGAKIALSQALVAEGDKVELRFVMSA